MTLVLSHRRSVTLDVLRDGLELPNAEEVRAFDDFDRIYRALCAILYNYVPMSGHPGGSISSGRFVAGLLFDGMDYDLSDPDRRDADVISYAAGHKALGLYGMWALRNEIARIAAPDLLPADPRQQLRLEDLLGFRKNPVTQTPRIAEFKSKALDGHPTPATPFVRLSTGASGVGVASSLGLAFAAADLYGPASPRFHLVEGEGGLTPGRVAESLAAAGTASLSNTLIHLDWNQSSIDSDRVCREGDQPGDYVQWTPMELFHLHDWNVIYVPDGKDAAQVLAAQRHAATLDNGQPTAIVYRTVKGWQYGIEGAASHGAGHKMCSPGFYRTIEPLASRLGVSLPLSPQEKDPSALADPAVLEACFWEALLLVRRALEAEPAMVQAMASRLRRSRQRLDQASRTYRAEAPRVEAIYEAVQEPENIPDSLRLVPGSSTTLRAELGRVLNHLNRRSGGAVLGAAADLLGSTSLSGMAEGFPKGWFHARNNPYSRILSTGGICEDAMAGILAGASAFGGHVGVGSSYGAFLAPLGHIAARLHAIGGQARRAIVPDEPHKPFVLVCAHAGLKTGEDGPTHADPQPLQLLQDNFPPGAMITLTPWDPQELWPAMAAALEQRPAVIAPFVTRPSEKVLDRAALGLAPATAAAKGLYVLRGGEGKDGTIVLQGSAVTYAFVTGALPLLDREGVDLRIYSVASAELFDLLPADERQALFPESRAREAMGITDFTLATMHRWITSERGRAASLHPFHKGHFLGSGPGERVLEEAGLDGPSQFKAVMRWVRER